MSRRWAWLVLGVLRLAMAGAGPVLVPQSGLRLGSTEVALNADGTWAASGSGESVVKLWRVPSGEIWREWPCAGWIIDLAFSPDGRYLAASDWTALRLWDLRSGEAVTWLPKVDEPDGRLAFSPDGRWLAVGATVVRLDPEHPSAFVTSRLPQTGRVAFDRAGHYLTVTGGQWSSRGAQYVLRFDLLTQRLVGRRRGDELPLASQWPVAGHRLLVVAQEAGRVGVVDVETGNLLAFKPPSTPTGDWTAHDVSSDGQFLTFATGSGAFVARLTGSPNTMRLRGASFYSMTTAFSGDGRRLLALVDDGEAVFDTSSGQRLATLPYDRSPDIVRVVRGGADRLCVWTKEQDLLWWDFRRGGAPRLRPTQSVPLAYQGDGNRLICQGSGSRLRSVDLTTKAITKLGGEANASENLPDEPYPLGLSSDGRLAASLAGGWWWSDQVPPARIIWQTVPAGQAPVVLPLPGLSRPIRLLAVSGDGDLVALGWDDELGGRQASLGVASRRAMRLLWQRPAFMDPRAAAFAPDGQTLLVAGQVGDFDDCQQMAVYGSADGQLRRWCAANDSAGAELAQSPDGRRAVTAGGSQLRLWDLGGHRPVREADVATYRIQRLSFDPSGRWLFTVGDNLVVRDAETLAARLTLVVGPQGSGRWLAYTPDGRWDGSEPLPVPLRYWVGDQLVPASRYPKLHQRGLVRDILRP